MPRREERWGEQEREDVAATPAKFTAEEGGVSWRPVVVECVGELRAAIQVTPNKNDADRLQGILAKLVQLVAD